MKNWLDRCISKSMRCYCLRLFFQTQQKYCLPNKKANRLVLTFNLNCNLLISPIIMYKLISYSRTPLLSKGRPKKPFENQTPTYTDFHSAVAYSSWIIVDLFLLFPAIPCLCTNERGCLFHPALKTFLRHYLIKPTCVLSGCGPGTEKRASVLALKEFWGGHDPDGWHHP